MMQASEYPRFFLIPVFSPTMYGVSLSSPNFVLGRGVPSWSVVVRVARVRACMGWMHPPGWLGRLRENIYARVEWSKKVHDVEAVGS